MPGPAQVDRARQLLALEGSGSSAAECAAAAARVYETLRTHLAPLVGHASLEMLLTRSARLAKRELDCLAEVVGPEGSATLRECLQRQDLAVAEASATALFAGFLSLVSTFIGERLTTEVLRSVWPTIEASALMEMKK